MKLFCLGASLHRIAYSVNTVADGPRNRVAAAISLVGINKTVVKSDATGSVAEITTS